jgi:chloramphenicol-sensitive protein RarD
VNDVHGDDHEFRRGVRAALAAYVLWGLLTVFWKELSGFAALELIGWRIVCATVVLALVITARRRWPAMRAAFADRALVVRLVIAALLLTANWTSYVWAVVDGRVIETALGYFMAPLGTMILGITVLHERPTRLRQVALACAVISVVILTVSYGRPPLIALVLATTWSVYGLLKRQVPLNAIESLSGETFVLFVPAVIVVVVMAQQRDSIPATASAADWLLVSLTGLVTAVPLLLFGVAAQRVPFSLLGPLQYLVPTINLLLGWLVYDEPMPLDRLVGFAFVWAGLLAVTLDQVRALTPQPAVPARLTPTGGG